MAGTGTEGDDLMADNFVRKLQKTVGNVEVKEMLKVSNFAGWSFLN